MPPERFCTYCRRHEPWMDLAPPGKVLVCELCEQECDESATCPLVGRVVAMEAQRHLQDVLDRQSTELFKEHSEALDAMEARLHALEELTCVPSPMANIELYCRLNDLEQLPVRPAAPAQRQPEHGCHTCGRLTWTLCDTCHDFSQWKPKMEPPAAPAQRQPVLCPACKRAAVATGEMAPHTASSHYTSDIYHCIYGDCWVHAFDPAMVPRQGAV